MSLKNTIKLYQLASGKRSEQLASVDADDFDELKQKD